MKYIFINLIALLFLACSPKYEIKTIYLQPSTHKEKVCVQECNVKRQTCQIYCNQKFNNCLERAKESAKNKFPALMDEYEYLMRKYDTNMHRYEGAISSWDRKHIRLEEKFHTYRELCDNKKNRKAYECRRAREVDNDLRNMENLEPTPPQRPDKPLLSKEIREEQKSCSKKCGCQKEYDNCFVSCGGTLDYKKICIENCK